MKNVLTCNKPLSGDANLMLAFLSIGLEYSISLTVCSRVINNLLENGIIADVMNIPMSN